MQAEGPWPCIFALLALAVILFKVYRIVKENYLWQSAHSIKTLRQFLKCYEQAKKFGSRAIVFLFAFGAVCRSRFPGLGMLSLIVTTGVAFLDICGDSSTHYTFLRCTLRDFLVAADYPVDAAGAKMCYGS